MFHEVVDVFPESGRHQAFLQVRKGRPYSPVPAGFPEKRGQPLFVFRIKQFPVPSLADQAGGTAAPGNQAKTAGSQRIIDNRPKRFYQAGKNKNIGQIVPGRQAYTFQPAGKNGADLHTAGQMLQLLFQTARSHNHKNGILRQTRGRSDQAFQILLRSQTPHIQDHLFAAQCVFFLQGKADGKRLAALHPESLFIPDNGEKNALSIVFPVPAACLRIR